MTSVRGGAFTGLCCWGSCVRAGPCPAPGPGKWDEGVGVVSSGQC